MFVVSVKSHTVIKFFLFCSLERPVHMFWETVIYAFTNKTGNVLQLLDVSADTRKSGILCEQGEY